MGQLKYFHESATRKLNATPSDTQSKHVAKTFNLIGIISVLLPLCALSLWSVSLKYVNIRQMNDLGLASVFPPSIFIAIVILIISFCVTLGQPQLHVSIILLHLIILIVMLYGVNVLVEEAPRFSTVYRHVGYTEYIMRTGSVDPSLDTYFSWPGFFMLSALLTRLAGYSSALAYAGWVPIFFNLIYFGPLYITLTTATSDKRLVWLGLWFFYLTNWIGQDYYSPQGINYFLYLVIIAILLKWFKTAPNRKLPIQLRCLRIFSQLSPHFQKVYDWLTFPDKLSTSSQPSERAALLTILLLIFAFSVFSHPLTPFFILASVTSLVFFRRCKPFWLPILMALMTAAWIIFMTQSFLVGHSSMVVGSVGHVGGSIVTNVTNRVTQGNPEHTFVATMRVVMTVILWVLAALGAFRRFRQGHHDITYILLAVAPFPLIAVQSYGGEMFLRIYLFALPIMAFFAAALFYTSHRLSIRGTSLWLTGACICMSMLLIAGFLITRYGNERIDYITYDELNGIKYLYNVAQPRSLFLEAWGDSPWQFQDYETFTYSSLGDIAPEAVTTSNINSIINYIEQQKHLHPDTYLLFTRSQRATSEVYAGLPLGTLDRLESAAIKSGKFKMIYENSDAQIFVFVDNKDKRG